jgi:hypothetical protein
VELTERGLISNARNFEFPENSASFLNQLKECRLTNCLTPTKPTPISVVEVATYVLDLKRDTASKRTALDD